ncbi:unnamed protein product [Amoebophrya sp. A120]|nr:unnamed protein product [Amoebophrya sp. A120]|eukprot:GSA120T00012106001.1
MVKSTPTRLYQKGVITSYKRARKDLTPRQCLVKIEGCQHPRADQLLQGKKGGFRLQVQEGEEELQVPRHLGQGSPRSRTQRYGACCFLHQLAVHRFRRPVPHHDVPLQHLNGSGVQGCELVIRDFFCITNGTISHARTY